MCCLCVWEHWADSFISRRSHWSNKHTLTRNSFHLIFRTARFLHIIFFLLSLAFLCFYFWFLPWFISLALSLLSPCPSAVVRTVLSGFPVWWLNYNREQLPLLLLLTVQIWAKGWWGFGWKPWVSVSWSNWVWFVFWVLGCFLFFFNEREIKQPHQCLSDTSEQGCMAFEIHPLLQSCTSSVVFWGSDKTLTRVLLPVQAEGSIPDSQACSRRPRCHLVHTTLVFRAINKTSAEKQIGVTARFSSPQAGRYDGYCAVRHLRDTEQSCGGTAGEIVLTSSKGLSLPLHLRSPPVRQISA